jgi:hypothetical protein
MNKTPAEISAGVVLARRFALTGKRSFPFMHDNIAKLATQNPDLAIERQEQLRELFLEAWSEGALDFSKLRTLLGDLSDESDERYRFVGRASANRSNCCKRLARHIAARAR